MGKPRGKASRERHRSLDPTEGKHDTAATAREESARASPHSRRGLTPLGRLQKYPEFHVSTGVSNYNNSLCNVREALLFNENYKDCFLYKKLQKDIENFLSLTKTE